MYAIIGIILLIFTFFSLIIIYNKGIQLKNYTEEASKEFMNVYMQESYNDVLDNSELIFADSFHGLDFYNNIMESVATCPILSLDDQISATEDFYENHKNDMGEKQASLYKTLVESANEMKESCKNIKAVATLLEESGDHKMTDFSNIIYEYKNHDKEHAMDAFKSYYESCDMGEALFYGVLAYESLDDTSIIAFLLLKALIESTTSILLFFNIFLSLSVRTDS